MSKILKEYFSFGLMFISYLEPVKDILLPHVSEHALVNEGTVASDITLKCFVNNSLKIL